MNREEKAAAVATIAEQIKESDAVLAVDYRGISVTQIADLRAKLRESDSTFRVVKNSLTERAADDAGVASLKELLNGPTALTFVRGDAASAAKVISTFNRETQLLEFKGGVMNGETLEVEEIKAIAKLPARDVLYGQLVGRSPRRSPALRAAWAACSADSRSRSAIFRARRSPARCRRASRPRPSGRGGTGGRG